MYHKISRNWTKTKNQIHSIWFKETTIFFFFEHANSFWSSKGNLNYPLFTVEIVFNSIEQCNSWNIWIDSFNQWKTQTTIKHKTFFENVSSWKWIVWAGSWPVVLTIEKLVCINEIIYFKIQICLKQAFHHFGLCIHILPRG